jgi:hypothetical protein
MEALLKNATTMPAHMLVLRSFFPSIYINLTSDHKISTYALDFIIPFEYVGVFLPIR